MGAYKNRRGWEGIKIQNNFRHDRNGNFEAKYREKMTTVQTTADLETKRVT